MSISFVFSALCRADLLIFIVTAGKSSGIRWIRERYHSHDAGFLTSGDRILGRGWSLRLRRYDEMSLRCASRSEKGAGASKREVAATAQKRSELVLTFALTA